ncbi:MAG: C39 family peptidase [Bacilli bacterium]
MILKRALQSTLLVGSISFCSTFLYVGAKYPEQVPVFIDNLGNLFQSSDATIEIESSKPLNVKPIYKEGAPSVTLNVPHIRQLPELPRGCEVTSLAMMLQEAGIRVTKMELANAIAKDKTPYLAKADGIHWGNPHEGFVGSMADATKPGYGVYIEPLIALAEEYIPNRVVNFTGQQPERILKHVSNGRPVLVITNTTFAPLSASEWFTVQTNDGPIPFTMKMHAVVITGYEPGWIIVNDPLSKTREQRIPANNFWLAWEEMGSQALSYL